MPIPPNEIVRAEQIQMDAARLPAPQVRLIAGPGTGKSSTIEKRVVWLLDEGVASHQIYVVSFTRASARDLQERVAEYCARHGHGNAGPIRVSTLHSLALRILRAAGLLNRYPVDPTVLDNWELEEIFDAEFGVASNIRSKVRQKEIRYYHEAHWSTGVFNPPNYLPPDPPISQNESDEFLAFQPLRTQLYSCVLPGEVIRQCVQEIQSGNIDPLPLLNVAQLIVDEFQDLNPMDLELVRELTNRGVTTFVAGDDDQSIYSFRFATPSGIQRFPQQHPAAAQATLEDCFRSMPEILGAATRLIQAFPAQNRIPKTSSSLYRNSNPPALGVVQRWRFVNAQRESQAIASSCTELIRRGVNPRDILVLLNNQRAVGKQIADFLTGAQVPFEPPRGESFLDTSVGRFVLALLRIVCNRDDYIAHRTLLGIRVGVGPATCQLIAQTVTDNNLNFRDLFYRPLPAGVFRGRAQTAIANCAQICQELLTWHEGNTLQDRLPDISHKIQEVLSDVEVVPWQNFAAQLPGDMTLAELRDYMWTDNDEQQAQIMQIVFARLGQVVPQNHLLPQRVRLMTMHGAKGLSGRIVFIPGLEDELLPGPWRAPYLGLVLEAARLLYVSITRARAACIVSYSTFRFLNGAMRRHTASRFTPHLNGPFIARDEGLTDVEADQIVLNCNQI